MVSDGIFWEKKDIRHIFQKHMLNQHVKYLLVETYPGNQHQYGFSENVHPGHAGGGIVPKGRGLDSS